MRLGTRIARVRGPTIDSMALHVDVEGVGLHVDQDRDDAGTDQRGDVRREGHRRGDHLVARLQAEQLDGEVERRGSRVAHDAPALAEQLGHSLFERTHVLADTEGLRAPTQDVEHRRDLPLVVDAPGVRDPALVPSWLHLQAEDALGVLPQEWAPHVVTERDVGHLGEDPIEAQAHRVVAGVHDLVGATRSWHSRRWPSGSTSGRTQRSCSRGPAT